MDQKICNCLFYCFRGVCGGGKENNMESMRDIKRVMEREIEKGSSPVRFSRIEFPDMPYHEVLTYLLRIREFSKYAGKTVGNNVYMDLDILCKKMMFRRTRSVIEREETYLRIQRYKKKLKPDYGGRLYLETLRCFFRMPEQEAEKCRMVYEGQETFAFIMSNKYILGLFTYCEAARKSAAKDGVGYKHLTEPEQRIVRLENVKDVLFQALLLDSVELCGNELSANLYTVYCLQ